VKTTGKNIEKANYGKGKRDLKRANAERREEKRGVAERQ